MADISNILVIVDPTANAHPAIAKAALLASRCNARMELYVCETTRSREERHAAHLASGSDDDFVRSVHVLLDGLAQQFRKQGTDVCIETDFGEPLHAKLLDRTQRTSADLVIKDTHHHSLAQRIFLTNTDWHLIRDCPVPLLLTRPKAWRQSPLIAAAVDPGHVNDKPELLDRQILDWAQLLVHDLSGTLHLLHAYLPTMPAIEDSGGAPVRTRPFTTGMMAELRAIRQKELETLASTCGISAWNLHLHMGIPADVLPRVAQDIDIDIMAMGAVSRSGLERLFVGSTAERILEHLACDVLVVKPPDFGALLPF